MRDLARFQQTFGRALLQSGEPQWAVRGSALSTALRVHRNTSMKGLVDALAANYPTVAKLVGEEWFKACSLAFARSYPARNPVLALYGEGFPGFISSFPPAADLPYLADVARIDRLWIEAHFAQDATPLSSDLLASLLPDALCAARPALHPATRFAWVRHSAATIWVHHRAATPTAELLVDDTQEGILLTRPAGSVEDRKLSHAGCRFLEHVNRGESLGQAAEAVLETDADANIAGLLATLLAAGAFANIPERAS